MERDESGRTFLPRNKGDVVSSFARIVESIGRPALFGLVPDGSVNLVLSGQVVIGLKRQNGS